MDVLEVFHAQQIALAADTRSLKLERQYRDLCRVDRLESALRLARTRLALLPGGPAIRRPHTGG